jgi:hypothetical protein
MPRGSYLYSEGHAAGAISYSRPHGGYLASPWGSLCCCSGNQNRCGAFPGRCGKISRFHASCGIPSAVVWSGSLLEFPWPRSKIVVPWSVPAFLSRCRADPCHSGEVAQDLTAPASLHGAEAKFSPFFCEPFLSRLEFLSKVNDF